MVTWTDGDLHGDMRIDLGKNSYDVIFGQDLFPRIAREMKEWGLGSKYAIVTDSNVEGLWAGKLADCFKAEGLDHKVIVVPAGEQSKSREMKAWLEDQMFEWEMDRKSAIVAIGGGMIGDLAGHVASTFLRGISYVNVPTTRLAMADSAIGGKTGIDTPYGKNTIGAIWQPRRNYIDVNLVMTMAEQDYRNSGAESPKHGILGDAKYFEDQEKKVDRILARDPETLLYIARKDCQIKATVVEEDEREAGRRAILNLGHTMAHSYEAMRGLEEHHGRCVSRGVMVACRIASMIGPWTPEETERVETLYNRMGLPTTFPADVSEEELLAGASGDKKSRGGKVRWCIPDGIGAMVPFGGAWTTEVDDEVALEAIRQTKANL